MKIDFLDDLTSNTETAKYINQIDEIVNNNYDGNFQQKYKHLVEENKEKENSCFLSVIIRTQGKRPDGLREALLCLQAQTCQDFEIIIIGHKMDTSNEKIVDEIIDDQSSELKAKIRYVKLDYGKRATPLNYGFAIAYGTYISIYDDDDILFDQWIEKIKLSAKDNSGRVLHLYSFTQLWKEFKGLGYGAVAAPIAQFCEDFTLISHLKLNKCPPVGLAFPALAFKRLNIMFNEELNVIEDWDYLMRVAFICGVTNIPETECIYRQWKNIETSATLHNEDEWKSTYDEVVSSFDNNIIVMPKGSVKSINAATVSSVVVQRPVSKLYYSFGKEFNDNECILTESIVPNFMDLWFHFENGVKGIEALRCDLTEEGLFLVSRLRVEVYLKNGEVEYIDNKNIVNNGISYNNKILFLHQDPELVFEWDKDKEIVDVHVVCAVTKHLYPKKIWRVLSAISNFSNRKLAKKLHNKGLF